MDTGHSHRDGATEHTENRTDPDEAVEAQEDGRVCRKELQSRPLEEGTKKDEEEEVRNENQNVPEANAEKRQQRRNKCDVMRALGME